MTQNRVLIINFKVSPFRCVPFDKDGTLESLNRVLKSCEMSAADIAYRLGASAAPGMTAGLVSKREIKRRQHLLNASIMRANAGNRRRQMRKYV